MFKKTTPEPTKLEKEIDHLLTDMAEEDRNTSIYNDMVTQLDVLYTKKLAEKELNQKTRVSAEAKVTIAANLAGILLIVGHERAFVISKTAISFVRQLR
jgi:hypothetical protein